VYKFELPSGTEIELREMTGAEEELLTNARLIRSGDALNQVLRNCITRIGDATEVTEKDVLDLLSGDRLFILLKLREISLGSEVDLELVCPQPSCRETNLLSVDLSEAKVTKYGIDREFVFELPGSKRSVRFTHLDGHKEKRLAALKEPSISSAMLIRILEVDGKPPTKKLLADMSLRDRTGLRKAMQKVDAGPDTVVAMECEACGSPIRTRLEAEAGFFFPEAR
jgi:hypothetical protein